jgi:hypothetical protein
MKTYFEAEIYTINSRPFKFSKGTGYNFSFALRGDALPDSDEVPTVWMYGVAFNHTIEDRRKYLVKGKLQVKPPYKDYPAGLQLIVSDAVLLEDGRYTVAKKRQAQHTAAYNDSPGADYGSPFPAQSPDIPM